MFDIDSLKFDSDGLIPAIVQDVEDGQVLMMAFMNRLAVEKTIETGLCHYWSRSRQKLWLKGETSGNTQTVKELYHDCDADCLLVKVVQKTAACHTGHRSCFYTKIDAEGAKDVGEKVFEASDVYTGSDILDKLYAVIADRKASPKEGSYTNKLLAGGADAVTAKLAEESAELAAALKGEGKPAVIHEAADLVYHMLVALAARDVAPSELYKELKARHKP